MIGNEQARRNARRYRRHHSGYSLLELMLAMMVYSLIMGSIGMAVSLVAGAHVRSSEQDGSHVAASNAALAITSDLRFAVSFSRRLVDAVEFTIPDRDGDGVDEKIGYFWSGNAGEPLQYTFNTLAPVSILDNVHAFDLGYVLETAASRPLGEELALLRYHDDAPDGHFHDHKIESQKWCAQFFLPSLPTGVTTWKIKRVRIMAKREGDDISGEFEVRITTADVANKPTSEILDSATVLESDLDKDYTWVDVDFTALNDLDPAKGLCLVLAQTTPGGSAAKIPYNHGGNPMTSGSHWLKSDNAGTSWSGPVNDKDMRFFVYGTYDNYTPDAHEFVEAVTLRVQAGSDPDMGVDTSVRLMNPPGALP